jgi:hypothetical protein
MSMYRIFAIISLSCLAACAGSVTERSHKVTVVTEPPNASCTLERGGVRTRLIGGTPVSFVVTRDGGDIDVECKLAGYQKTTGTLRSGFEPLLIGNFLTGGPVGLVRDIGTGFVHRYPGRITIVLPPLPATTAVQR